MVDVTGTTRAGSRQSKVDAINSSVSNIVPISRIFESFNAASAVRSSSCQRESVEEIADAQDALYSFFLPA